MLRSQFSFFRFAREPFDSLETKPSVCIFRPTSTHDFVSFYDSIEWYDFIRVYYSQLTYLYNYYTLMLLHFFDINNDNLHRSVYIGYSLTKFS